ncbi:MAG: CRISPR-associated protein Cas5 [Salinibacter sp.]
MTALQFELKGKFAHFRRFYTNSSSLSYPVPPPPTIAGLLGAALGLNPDEYRDVFRDVRFAVRPRASWRQLMQAVNLLKITEGSENSLRGEEGHTQIPTQLIAPIDLDDTLAYEVVLSGLEGERRDRLGAALAAPHYPLYLGTAPCRAWVEETMPLEGEVRDGYRGELLGALDVEATADLALEEGLRVLRDRYPIRLGQDRRLTEAKDLFVEAEGQALTCTYDGPVLVSDRGAYALL